MKHDPPVDYRGKRYDHTLLLIRARDILLMEAARYFPSGSARETAKKILDALKVYRNGRWNRDRVAPSPPEYADYRLLFFAILTLHDHLPCDRVVRAAVARARQ
ncbi:hypothetical protein HU675_0016250 [Bradyrhizobium septentrionale]|uniref:hypothetical protein n=1 Tax=Bradyrhizobium septentrionale TaxID=1404411 RepID=UPI001596A2A7|nr:hypothetical protein [Bradyrhizobium septentrionale]UGY28181.1 hypothetical protein HU675_0016250 [Bradyrhizobium septentrionale]